MEENKKNYINDINNIKKRFENKLKFRKDIYIIRLKNIIHNYYLKINKLKNFFKNKKNKFLTEINHKMNYKQNIFDKSITKYKELIQINELVYNVFNAYKEEYYNNLNIINIITVYNGKEVEIQNNNIKNKKKEKKIQ